jgi:hypothetical protein
MSVQEVEQAVQAWPREHQEQLREWLDDLLEDQLELTDEFKATIERGFAEIAAGKGRVRKP